MSRYFLAKTDPETYSIRDFSKDRETKWDGVHNFQAIAVIKKWDIGDVVLIYHSQGEAKIVGLAEVVSQPEKDLNDKKGISWYARLKFVKEFDERQKISLKEVKSSGLFNDFALVRQSRLSTMECPIEFIEWLKIKGVDFSYL